MRLEPADKSEPEDHLSRPKAEPVIGPSSKEKWPTTVSDLGYKLTTGDLYVKRILLS